MQVDFLTLACLRDCLDALLGARVQKVLLPDERSIGLELYYGERRHLLASAFPQHPRLLLTPESPRRGVEVQTPMLLLLRKWVRGSRLVDVTQPPWERVLVLHFEGRAGVCRLVVELMGRYSNLVLVGIDGRVLAAVKHVGPDVNRHRVTLPGQPYCLPPMPPNRRPPTGITVDEWKARLALAPADELFHRWLLGRFLGISRPVAREIAFRANGDPEALASGVPPEAVAQAVEELFAPLENGWWEPHVALDETDAVVAFAAYRPHQFDGSSEFRVEVAADINQAMWRYFEARQMTDPYAAARQTVRALLQKIQDRLDRKKAKLQGQHVDGDEINSLRLAGELLLTYQAQVPTGAQEVTLTDYEGAQRSIALDSAQSPVENAQRYFRRYDKARRAADQIPPLIKRLEIDRVYLAQLKADLLIAESRPEIDAVREAMADAGWAEKGRRKKTDSGQVSEPRRFELDGFPIYVGRNAHQNEQVTFKRAGPEDLWLHVRGMPGAHVVVKCGHRETPEDVVQCAARLAAYYSTAREEGGRVAVDVTQRRFVRRLRGGHPGLVTYRDECTVWVQDFDEPDEMLG